MRDLQDPLHDPVTAPPFETDGTLPLPDHLAGAVMLLGSFDGMHRGHAALVAVARAEAARRAVPLAILQCDPHPRLYFAGPSRFRIAAGSARDRLLAAAGIGLVYAPRFDAAFAATPADAFVDRILHDRLRLGAVVVGPDFRFGRGREGTVAGLVARAGRHGIAVRVLDEQRACGRRISSSAIRAAIRDGRLAEAIALLGHGWSTPLRAAAPGEGTRWHFAPDQLLPPAGRWPVTARDGAGRTLARTTIDLCPDGSARAALPRATDSLDWHAPPSDGDPK
ncbi:hypothetical protein [Frigidibacter sp. MR17.24]|uniref:hypothetical protein n=1 Tax=Frigidibacter sp. MR17.24 TaxID=3127345 RepID=UPI0030130A42